MSLNSTHLEILFKIIQTKMFNPSNTLLKRYFYLFSSLAILTCPTIVFAESNLWWTGACNNDFSVLENWSSTPLSCDGSRGTAVTEMPSQETTFNFTDGSFWNFSDYEINFDAPILIQKIFIEGYGNADRVNFAGYHYKSAEEFLDYNIAYPIQDPSTYSQSKKQITSVHKSSSYESSTAMSVFFTLKDIRVDKDSNETGSTINLSSNLSVGLAPYVYQWSGPNGYTSTQSTPSILLDNEDINGIYTLEIQDANGCTSLSETMLNIDFNPEEPIAETEAVVCSGSDIVLGVNDPEPEQLYRWFRAIDDIELGQGAILNIPNASENEEGGYYVTASNSECTSNRSNIVEVVVNIMSSDIAIAVTDEVVCENNIILNANPVTEGEGRWVNLNANSNTIITNPDDAATNVSNLQIGQNQFAWSVSNGVCIESSVDTITITYNETPTAQDDIYNTKINQALVENILDNDSPNAAEFTVNNFTNPQNGMLTLTNDGSFNFQPNLNFVGTDSYSYELCHLYCPDKCVEATVFITIGQDAECFASTIITANDDGINDTFTISCLNNYTNSHMCIFNRWGAEVFRSENYQNDWDGTK